VIGVNVTPSSKNAVPPAFSPVCAPRHDFLQALVGNVVELLSASAQGAAWPCAVAE
jgi:hypothetical protein